MGRSRPQQSCFSEMSSVTPFSTPYPSALFVRRCLRDDQHQGVEAELRHFGLCLGHGAGCPSKTNSGAPGWQSQPSVQLRLRSRYHGSWVWAVSPGPTWDPVFLCPSPARANTCSLSKTNINNQTNSFSVHIVPYRHPQAETKVNYRLIPRKCWFCSEAGILKPSAPVFLICIFVLRQLCR